MKSPLRAGFGSLCAASQAGARAMLHRFGVSPLMLGLRRQARERGEHLHFGLKSVRWERKGWTVYFPVDQPYLVTCMMRQGEKTFQAIVSDEIGGRRVVDFRRPVLYRMRSGRLVWLPSPMEAADAFSGYIAKGAPGLGDTVLDAGAFCGESVIEFAQLVGPRGHVFALEPDAANLALLRQNLEIHRLENVTVLPVALWNRSTTLVFMAEGNCGSFVGATNQRPAGKTRSTAVEALTPADLFRRMGGVPDFIKMDIEGAEVEVLEALAPVLAAEAKPVRLAIASYHLRDGRPTHELITRVLRAAGYAVETGNPEHVTTWAWRA